MFYLMLYWTGVRISEALNITAHNIDYTEGVVVIESLKKRRRGQFRKIPIPDRFLAELKEYITINAIEDKLWTWARRTASRYVKTVMKKAGISGSKASSKGLRHSFAVACVVQNVPLTLVQKWMGHASLSTTSIYLDIVGVEERYFAKRLW